MTIDPRFNPPGPSGPGAGTGGPAPEPAAQPSNGTAAPAEEQVVDDEPVLDGEFVADTATPDTATPDAATPDTGSAPVDVDALQAKAAKADEYLGLAQRTQADFENYRKRSAREAAAATQRGATKLTKELLPAVDNLERALAHAPEASSDSELAFLEGIKHVHSDLIAALQRAGIERYSPEGEPFDPTLHEAVAQQPIDGFAPGTVVEVFQRGYRIGENVVRPARVVVAG
jgi:molecular chaperone GrpE